MTTPDDSEYGVVEASAMLTFEAGVPDVFRYDSGMRVASLAVATVAPGVRGWALTLAIPQVPAVGTVLFLMTDVAFGKVQAKILVSNGPAIVVYLVDTTTGLPIDPATVQALAPGQFFGVQLHGVTVGSASGVAP